MSDERIAGIETRVNVLCEMMKEVRERLGIKVTYPMYSFGDPVEVLRDGEWTPAIYVGSHNASVHCVYQAETWGGWEWCSRNADEVRPA